MGSAPPGRLGGVTILFLTQDYFPRIGGITTWVHELARGLRGIGAEARVAARSFPGEPWDDSALPYPVTRLPGVRWRNRKYAVVYRHLRRLAREERSPVVICADWKLGIPVLLHGLLHPRRRFRWVVAVHGKDYAEKRAFHRAMMRLVLGRCSRVVTGASAVRDLVLGTLRRARRIDVIPYGTDAGRFRPLPVGEDFRAEHGIPAGVPIVLSVGRLVERKGFDNVIRALPIVLRRHPDLVYLIGGTGADEGRLHALVDGLGLRDHVAFHGLLPAEELPAWYNLCDVFVMPSRSIGSDIEGFGIALLEAGACGKPVIAGDSGGIPDAVEDGGSGILVDPENVEAIAEAILAVLADGETARRLGTRGYERVHAGFLWSHIARRYAELLEGIGSDARR